MAFPLIHHINGTTHVISQTNDGYLEELGVSVNGITFKIETQYSDIFTDQWGPKTPWDKEYLLQDVTFSCELIYYNQDVLYKWLQGIPNPANPNTFGLGGNSGDLVIGNNLTAGIILRNTPQGTGLTDVENCWRFYQCILIDAAEVTFGVNKSIWKLSWKPLYFQQSSGSYGAVLFDQTCQ